MKHFLQYWEPEVAQNSWARGEMLDYSGSNQFKKMSVKVGDIVWIVTCDEQKRLILIGRIIVDRITHDRKSAEKEYSKNLWPSEYHVFGSGQTICKIFRKDITKCASRMRFVSRASMSLRINNGQIDAKQLQSIRILEYSSANLLNIALFGNELPPEEEIQYNLKNGLGFGNPEDNKKIENASVNFVIKSYKGDGWKVKSVESDKLGYDLECKKNGSIENVEVKGKHGSDVCFIITEKEARFAKTDDTFVLCLVNNALDRNKRKLTKYNAIEFRNKFRLQPLAYKAVLKVE